MLGSDDEKDYKPSDRKTVRNWYFHEDLTWFLMNIPLQSRRSSVQSSISMSAGNCRHLNVVDYSRIIVSSKGKLWRILFKNAVFFQNGLPPMLRRSKPLERPLPVRQLLPRISLTDPAELKRKRLEAAKKNSIDAVDIETLIETRVKKLKQNAFLYMMHAVPITSEHFTPYNLV